jgi:hypothetical protein
MWFSERKNFGEPKCHEKGRAKRKGQSEEKIVYELRQVEAGKKVSEVCREMGVSAQAFCSWKRRYAGLAGRRKRRRSQWVPCLVQF